MKDLKDNVIIVKSMDFAVRCVRLAHYIRENYKEYDLASQITRSGTSIGANAREAIRGQSRADFRAKMNIALKEASETSYWLELLLKVNYITESQHKSLDSDCTELCKLLTSIVKTAADKKDTSK